MTEKPPLMSDHQWSWHKLCQEHGEQEAKRIVCGWLRTIADEIENDRYPEVFGAERDEIGPLDMHPRITKEDSLRASGMHEMVHHFRRMAGNLFAIHEDAAAKCFRTAADIACDRASHLLKQGRYVPED